MTKTVSNEVYDEALNFIKNNADQLHACTAVPVDYNAALLLSVAERDLTAADYGVPTTVDTKRQLPVDEQTNIPITIEGLITHMVWVDTVNLTVLVINNLTEPYSACVGRDFSLNATTISLGEAA